uniref:Uncharacterized protein n=1 Tax=Vespula pensylvanica TaxID=30213 RepID=A0A834PEY7_VESPE|nr:hypothetical protein H0235_000870 [Vespula pensylvanica]
MSKDGCRGRTRGRMMYRDSLNIAPGIIQARQAHLCRVAPFPLALDPQIVPLCRWSFDGPAVVKPRIENEWKEVSWCLIEFSAITGIALERLYIAR